MAKRKAGMASSDFIDDMFSSSTSTSEHKFTKRTKIDQNVKKHTLDSDEEDFDDDSHMKEDDIEGEEDVVAPQEEGVRFTAFNMHEEMEEGHFDKDGHFIWNNEKEIRDNWLDDIDWQKVKQTSTKYDLPGTGNVEKGLADSSDSESEDEGSFNETEIYKQILSHLKPKESVSKAIRRYGGNKKPLSSLERLKLKKSAALTTNEEVTKLTELANNLLTKTGNMDIYQETYEIIQNKIAKKEAKEAKTKDTVAPEIDMYSDDFLENEKKKIEENSPIILSVSKQEKLKDNSEENEVLWEFKWTQGNQHIEGPFPTSKMLKWFNEGYFKKDIWVRKHGDMNNFYRSDRIDFEIYL